jgi:nicotinate-nucleotide--dimethylbenzimidazole phosphoribosyltransferase
MDMLETWSSTPRRFKEIRVDSVTSMAALRGLLHDLPSGDDTAEAAARSRQAELTKPAGSLGRLEDLAVWLARWQGRAMPRLDRVRVAVFAGNHGVAARGVSAYPSSVTAQMVANFAAGGAAINQLAQLARAELTVVPLGLEHPTADFTAAPALDEASFLAAVNAGCAVVEPGLDLLCIGEMGIGNTTAAAAVCAALYGGGAVAWAGRGTGVDDAGLAGKRRVIDEALHFHGKNLDDPLEVLRRLGGRELAAMFGATLAARRSGVPVLIDGFVATAAVAPLSLLATHGLAHASASHCSAEAAHRFLLANLCLDPLLDLGLRLGEASGAALAVLLLRAALACHSGMATFAEASVAGRTGT